MNFFPALCNVVVEAFPNRVQNVKQPKPSCTYFPIALLQCAPITQIPFQWYQSTPPYQQKKTAEKVSERLITILSIVSQPKFVESPPFWFHCHKPTFHRCAPSRNSLTFWCPAHPSPNSFLILKCQLPHPICHMPRKRNPILLQDSFLLSLKVHNCSFQSSLGSRPT